MSSAGTNAGCIKNLPLSITVGTVHDGTEKNSSGNESIKSANCVSIIGGPKH